MSRSYVRLNAEQKEELVELYVSGETCQNLANKYGISHGAAYNIVAKCGVNRSCRFDYFDDRFFRCIDTEQSSYWLGFLYADGNVYKNTLCLALSSCDVKHIEKLKLCLNSSAKMRYRTSNDSWSIKFNSKIMVNDLAYYGLVPCKSHIISTPKIDADLLRHFYRGYFDGDGWLTYREKRKTWSIGVVSGSRSFVEDIRLWMGERIGSNANIVDKKKKNAFQLVFEGNRQVKKAAQLLYDDSNVFLDRKHKSAMEILG